MQIAEINQRQLVNEKLEDGLTIRNATPADREGLLQLQKEYLGIDSELEITYLVDGYFPGIGIEDFLVVTTESGQIVAALMLMQIDFRIGQTWLKVGQPEFVVTHPDYRGRGIIRKLFAILDKWMQAYQIPLAFIGGISYFYRQFGYEYALDSSFPATFKPENLAQIPVAPDITVRRARPEDAAAMYRLTTETAAKDDWEIKTYPHSLEWSQTHRSWENKSPVDYVAERAGEILCFGRIWRGWNGFYSTAIHGDNLEGSQALAAMNLQLEDAQTLRLGGPHGGAFERWVTEDLKLERKPGWSWYVRVNDPLAMFQTLAGEFERRVAASAFAGLSQEVILGFYRYQIRLLFEDGKIKEITRLPGEQDPAIGIPPDLLPKLIMGYRTIDELKYIYPDILSPKHWDLLKVLFPKLYGQMRFFIF